MNNKELARLLRSIAAAYSIKDEKKYRFQILAYQTAADSIEHLNTEFKDLIKENKYKKIPGIGPTITEHLEELFRTGKVKHFEELKKTVPEAIFPLLDVPTFGPKKAYKIVSAFKLKDPKTVVKDVEALAKEGKIAKLPTFGEKSQEDILRAINEYKQGKTKSTRMVLPFASELAQKILGYLKLSKDVEKAYPLGSLRRSVSTVGDVDIAVASSNPKAVLEHFTSYPNKERVIEKGDVTASILTGGGHQVDLMIQKPESFGSLLQHFTGSKEHNIALREYALSKGMSLSEYGIKLKREPETKKFSTEEAFYNFIGLDWIPPEIRENKGEIQLAAKHKLPKLVELKDIKGDLHTHSNFPIEPSHDLGQNTPEEMLKKAESLGYEYLGFSEHNPSITNHTEKEIFNLLSRRKDKIEQLYESNKIVRVINLLEIDILANGELPINYKMLDLIDAAIVSIHSSFSMDKKKMTERILKGLSHPKAKILGHPTGRMLNQRPGYEADWEKIFDFAVKNNKALEINAWPNRLDLPDTLIRQAKEKGVKFVIDTDSHAADQMDLMPYGVAVARRGWCTKEDILNTLPYEKFMEWLKD
ncbi:MAG: DNA polymerase/3'-5' exonuclease PolX [Patescibacteria group bacterium]|nr:DNA polymerase/3'-5' exonuclease PolX [Patescibacteria group bacterium]MCL5113864.1 DNA polymerase/3'-5' exonuclease PolX [Patescibacteria group bacterium]